MPSTFDFFVPTRATTVPTSPDWLREIKYDGYRLRLERDRMMRVRLITKGDGEEPQASGDGADRSTRFLRRPK